MKGLTTNIKLHEGKFQLVGGKEKARDNIRFFCIFDKFRVYTSDFGGNFVSLAQKPVSYLILNKTLIIGSLKKKMKKFLPNINVDEIDIGYMSNNRKEYSMQIGYSVKLENNVEIQDVTFV